MQIRHHFSPPTKFLFLFLFFSAYSSTNYRRMKSIYKQTCYNLIFMHLKKINKYYIIMLNATLPQAVLQHCIYCTLFAFPKQDHRFAPTDVTTLTKQCHAVNTCCKRLVATGLYFCLSFLTFLSLSLSPPSSHVCQYIR